MMDWYVQVVADTDDGATQGYALGRLFAFARSCCILINTLVLLLIVYWLILFLAGLAWRFLGIQPHEELDQPGLRGRVCGPVDLVDQHQIGFGLAPSPNCIRRDRRPDPLDHALAPSIITKISKDYDVAVIPGVDLDEIVVADRGNHLHQRRLAQSRRASNQQNLKKDGMR